MKFRYLPVAIALAAVAVLSGCIQMTVDQTVQKDGSSHVVVTYDATEFMTSMEGTEGFEASQTNFAAACEEFLAATSWQNPACTTEGFIATYSGDIQLTEPAFTVSRGVAKYDMKDLYNTLNAVGDSQDQDFSDEGLLAQKESVELTGVTLTYNLTMPGPITSNEAGTVNAENPNQVNVDIFSIAGLEHAFVEASVPGLDPVLIGGIVGGVVLLLVIVAVVMKVKKKKGAAPAAPAPSAPVSPSTPQGPAAS